MPEESNTNAKIKDKRRGRPVGSTDSKPRRQRPRGLIIKDEEAGEMPLDYMLRVMRDRRTDKARRDQMAKWSAPYCHATYASIKMNHEGPNLAQLFAGMTADELAAFERFAAAVARLQPQRLAIGYSGGEGQTGG